MSRKCVDCKYRHVDIDDEPCKDCLLAQNYEQGEPIEPEIKED